MRFVRMKKVLRSNLLKPSQSYPKMRMQEVKH
jgi:hypothetical protein